jgi:hypothetical protein
MAGEVSFDGDEVTIRTGVPTRDLAALTQWGIERGVEFASLQLVRRRFEEVHLDLVGAPGGPGDG